MTGGSGVVGLAVVRHFGYSGGAKWVRLSWLLVDRWHRVAADFSLLKIQHPQLLSVAHNELRPFPFHGRNLQRVNRLALAVADDADASIVHCDVFSVPAGKR